MICIPGTEISTFTLREIEISMSFLAKNIFCVNQVTFILR